MAKWIPPCETCDGSGVYRCPTCKGRKKIKDNGEERTCPECNGIGLVISHCMYCDEPGKWQVFYMAPKDTPDKEMGRYNGDWEVERKNREASQQ